MHGTQTGLKPGQEAWRSWNSAVCLITLQRFLGKSSGHFLDLSILPTLVSLFFNQGEDIVYTNHAHISGIHTHSPTVGRQGVSEFWGAVVKEALARLLFEFKQYHKWSRASFKSGSSLSHIKNMNSLPISTNHGWKDWKTSAEPSEHRRWVERHHRLARSRF